MTEAAFGVQLRQSRQAAALSLRQLATRVGYDHSYLSQVERGRRPGSTHLAQLCDRELGTGTALATAFQQNHPVEQQAGSPVSSVQRLSAVDRSAGDVLEAVRHRLTGSFGQLREGDEWNAVVTAYGREFATTPLADLLPALTADLQLLHAATIPGSAELAGPAAELATLMGMTLTGLGRVRAAGRWWRTARLTADSAAQAVASRVRSWEALSGPAEGRPLPEMLGLADEALALAERPLEVARAVAARAKVLALLNQSGDARQALQELREVAESLPGTTPPHDWPLYEVDRVESFVCTALGDTLHAYFAQDRALSSCPLEYVRERAELELQLAQCLIVDGDVAAGLSTAMRVLVELEDQWHTHYLYDVAGRVLSAVQGRDAGRPAVRDYRELLKRRPYYGRSVGSGSSPAMA